MMTSHVPLVMGIVVGLSIAVPIGPLGLLCIQRTLTYGMRVGVSTGLGGVTVNVLYGALILVGLDQAEGLVASGGRVLNFGGGVFLLWTAARTALCRRSLTGQAVVVPLSAVSAYGSAVAFNVTNPLPPVLMVALLAPVVAAHAPSFAGAMLLLLGMFVAAASWWVCLTAGISLLRSRLSPAMLRMVNHAAAVALTFYGALALARSAGM